MAMYTMAVRRWLPIARAGLIQENYQAGYNDGQWGYANKASLLSRDPERQAAYSRGYKAGWAIRFAT